MEADRIGFRLAVGAGYDKDQVGKFYEKLLDAEKAGRSGGGVLRSLSDAMSTHPPSEERVKQMKELAGSQTASRNALLTTPAFSRARQISQGMQKKP